MKVSLNWLRDFVDIPEGISPRELAERFTMTTAEVESVEEVRVDCQGLVAGKVLSVSRISETLHEAVIDAGGHEFRTVTAAAGLKEGAAVVFAPPGAVVAGGQIGRAEVSGRISEGMIVPAESLGMTEIRGEAVFLPEDTPAGTPVDLSDLNDWVIEIDNKSITHRPDLWGHYGIAREFAAMLSLPLKPYPVVPADELQNPDLPEIPIEIDDPTLCPRYSGLMMGGLRNDPAPLWMQGRLARVGIRPINLIVDLTNYIMAELGQPMHAFDGDKVDRIEVAVARPGERFVTLDGVERVMPAGALMIQCRRKSIALAGIMGGAETEVTEQTRKVLLESANFNPATIRKTANALAHRTEASTRFEKSLDPNYTILGIQRFVYLARQQGSDPKLLSRLSDCYPRPAEPVSIEVDLDFASRFMGRPIKYEEAKRILEALEFRVERLDDHRVLVHVPSFRATRDITIQADVIEEIARFVGYGNIEPQLPRVTVRALEPDRMHVLESRTLSLLCEGRGYCEVHTYIWYDSAWLRRLGYDPGRCVELRNPAAAGQERLRREMAPTMLALLERNRHWFEQIKLAEVGSVFEPGQGEDIERRHLVLARAQRGDEEALLVQVKQDLELWADEIVGRQLRYRQVRPEDVRPWESAYKTAEILVAGRAVGRVSPVPLECRLRIDQHLRRWAMVIAEVCLSDLLDLEPAVATLGRLPTFPEVSMDFSVLADATVRYSELEQRIAQFEHPLLRRLSLVDCYEGPAIPEGKRSLTFRARLGHSERTLSEEDLQQFQQAFVRYLEGLGLSLRSGPARR